MREYLYDLREIDKTMTAQVGGKAANLGELTRIKGIQVPEGFCISTEVFKRIVDSSDSLNELLDQLSFLKVEDRDKINELAFRIRNTIEELTIPVDTKEAILRFLSRHGDDKSYAIRSSATAEDLPTASFAGQQDSFLNIMGREEILEHIKKCWASLYTDRAIIYRLQNGFDQRKVSMSVIIQQMIFPVAAGIMFTADPVSSNRKLLSIDAGFGLGEAMVSGITDTDNYKVKDGKILEKRIAKKTLAVHALKNGGTEKRVIKPDNQNIQTLNDEQILRLEIIGRTIEDHFSSPQDIEWCLAKQDFYVVQSRPITSLFPIPEAKDKENRVYVSVGHQQMMTDTIKPLGLSFFLLTTRAPMHIAGGRLFVDITKNLSSPIGRKAVIEGLGKSDPLIKDALLSIAEREDFIKLETVEQEIPAALKSSTEIPSPVFKPKIENNPAIASDFIAQFQASLEEAKQNIPKKSGIDVFDFILESLQGLKKILFDPKIWS